MDEFRRYRYQDLDWHAYPAKIRSQIWNNPVGGSQRSVIDSDAWIDAWADLMVLADVGLDGLED